MLISLIIPVYNSEKFIGELLKCLINQTYRNIEIILINDGSTDSSLEVCKEYKNKDDRIIIFNQKNSGVSTARNKGIELAHGQYITFIDSDDNIAENYIEELLNNLEEDYLIKNNYKKQINEGIYSKEDFLNKIISGKVLGVCWGYLFEKNKIENLRFDTNTSYMEDTLFLVKYLLRISKVKVIKHDLYYQSKNENSLTKRNKDIENRINGYIYSINKIEKELENNKIFYKKELENRRIEIIEAEFAQIYNKEELKKLVENKNVQAIKNYKKIHIKYKAFHSFILCSNIRGIYIYNILRRIIKNIVKGR